MTKPSAAMERAIEIVDEYWAQKGPRGDSIRRFLPLRFRSEIEDLITRALAEKDAEIESVTRQLEMLMGDRMRADAALAHMNEVAQHNADAEMARSEELSSLLTWAREAREILDDSSLLATSEMDFRIRALLARAPEGTR